MAQNHLSDIKTEDFIKIYREGTAEPSVNDTSLASDNPLRLRKLFLRFNKNHDD